MNNKYDFEEDFMDLIEMINQYNKNIKALTEKIILNNQLPEKSHITTKKVKI